MISDGFGGVGYSKGSLPVVSLPYQVKRSSAGGDVYLGYAAICRMGSMSYVGLLAFSDAGAKGVAPKLPPDSINCRAMTLPRESPGGQLQMCEALSGSDDFVQSV